MTPIWKDYTIDAGAVDSRDFSVSLRGATVFSGKAYRRPGETNVYLRVNDIVAEYLHNEFPALPPVGTTTNTSEAAPGGARVTVLYGSSSAVIDFYCDWSYDPVMAANADVNRNLTTLPFETVDPRLPLVTTQFRSTAEFLNFCSVKAAGGQAAVGSKVAVWADTCYRYALYYLNAYGGWDFIYLEAVKAERDFERQTAKRIYDSADLKARGTFNYVNQVTQRWTAKTPNLTDAQSALMWHVLGTTAAFLFDMQTQNLTPVNLTGASAEEKTYRNQGIKRPRYDLNFTLAQDRLRK